MIKGPENVRDIFSIFHDGAVGSCRRNGDELTLEVGIRYRAERVQPEFRKFQVRLFGVSSLRFSTWPSDLQSAPAVLTDTRKIFEAELQILESNLKDDEVEVVCNQHSSAFAYCGGELRFHCVRAEVVDEGRRVTRLKS